LALLARLRLRKTVAGRRITRVVDRASISIVTALWKVYALPLDALGRDEAPIWGLALNGVLLIDNTLVVDADLGLTEVVEVAVGGAETAIVDWSANTAPVTTAVALRAPISVVARVAVLSGRLHHAALVRCTHVRGTDLTVVGAHDGLAEVTRIVFEADIYGAMVPVVTLVPCTAVVFALPKGVFGVVLQVVGGTRSPNRNLELLTVVVHMADDDLFLNAGSLCRVSEEERRHGEQDRERRSQAHATD